MRSRSVSGADTVRPSVRVTYISFSSQRTEDARPGLWREEVAPRRDPLVFVGFRDVEDLTNLPPTVSAARCDPDGYEPDLRSAALADRVDVRRLTSVGGTKVEGVAALAVNC